MADQKITALSATTTVTDDDLFVIVDDPSGTPTNKKITAANLRTSIGAGSTATGSSTSFNTSTSQGWVTITGSGSANTKGSWSELIASTSITGQTVVVGLLSSTNLTNTNTDAVLDIGIGAASSETVLIADIQCGNKSPGTLLGIFEISVPSGSRISARLAGVQTSKTADISVLVTAAGGNRATTTCTTYGVDSANSRGVNLTVPGASNTESAWTEIVASTSADIKKMIVDACVGTATGIAGQSAIDIGYGAASSEVAVIEDIVLRCNTSEQSLSPFQGVPYSCDIPSGSRLVARYRASSTSTSQRPHVAIHGMS